MKRKYDHKHQVAGKKNSPPEIKVADALRSKKENKRVHSGLKSPSNTAKASSPLNWKYIWALIIILLISFIAYLPVLHNGFVNWDDNGYIINNPLIYSFNLKDFFSQNVMGNYHPFTILTLALEYHFFGLESTGYHTVNLLLHLLNVILVFYTVFLISENAGVALVASLLFGIHPMHVESVAWASELKDLLYTCFFLASYFFYLKYLKDLKKKYYVIALFLFLVSLLSKAMAASLPLILLLTDYFKERKINIKIILEKIPFFLLAIALGVVAILAQKSGGAVQSMASFSFPQRIVFAGYGFISYIFKLIIPLNLSAFYPYPITSGANIPILYFLFLILFVILVASVYYSLRFTRKIFFGFGFFMLTIFLVLQLLPIGGAIMADRYSYLPSIGFFYLTGEGFILLWNKRLKLFSAFFLGVFTLFFSASTYARCGVWNNSLTLWNNVIDQYQTIPYAYNNRGQFLMDQKKYDKAIEDFSKAIELKPNHISAVYNRGNAFMKEQKYDKALEDFNKAIELDPNYFEAYLNRGEIFYIKKRYDLALADCNKAIVLNPNLAAAYLNRAAVFYVEGKFQEAIIDYTKAIAFNADATDAIYYRGLAEYKLGKKEDACADMKHAASLGHKSAADAVIQLCK